MRTIRLIIPHTGDPSAAQRLVDGAIALAEAPAFTSWQIIGPEAGDGIAAKWSAARLDADYLWFLADDAKIQTPAWDRIVRRAFQHWPDEVGLVHGDDSYWKDRLAVLPLISSDALRLLGHKWFSLYYRYRLDDHLHQVFDMAGRRLYLGSALRCEAPGHETTLEERGHDEYMHTALAQLRLLQTAHLRALRERVVIQ